ncbi:hypothetical protein [Hymenobacter edaphi]|uniref:hypothetical protein n=1 Tax=Hymenobacter edaphi TaxID=2211146 RepID=UPI00140397CD|nr:hypothetical protein [Hymenobacter edaphi]
MEPAPADELIRAVQAELGHKFPALYVDQMRQHNGTMPRSTCFPTSWPRTSRHSCGAW